MTVQRYGDRTKVHQITAVSEVSSSTLQPGDATGRWVLGMKEQNNEVEGWFAAVAPYRPVLEVKASKGEFQGCR